MASADDLEQMARTSPERALAYAMGAEAEARSELLQAVLRGWAAVDPDAAASWAAAQPWLPHGLAFAALFRGAAARPADARRLADQLCATDPARARDYGSYLIHGLGRAGEHPLAASFAVAGARELQPDWITAAFTEWGEADPLAAVAQAGSLSDEARPMAVRAAITGWARSAPATLADTAVGLPSGAERKFAMIAALQTWFATDPTAAADWARRHAANAGISADELRRMLED